MNRRCVQQCAVSNQNRQSEEKSTATGMVANRALRTEKFNAQVQCGERTKEPRRAIIKVVWQGGRCGGGSVWWWYREVKERWMGGRQKIEKCVYWQKLPRQEESSGGRR